MSNGIVVKVWNIKGESVAKGTKAQLSDSMGYILNDEKTTAQVEFDPLDQLTRECKYVENDLKTFSGAYVGGHNIISTEVSAAVEEMMKVKEFFNKKNGRAALHMLISLPEEESDPNNASRLMQLCSDVLNEVFPDHQAVFAVHTNTDNLHVHIIVNSVGLNGKKIHQDNNFISKVLQPCVNKYAKWYNFTPNSKWEKKESSSKYTYPQLKAELRKAIDAAIENAESFETFVSNLKEQGIDVRAGKHISLKIPGVDKAVRTHQLGSSYTRDAIIERIATKREKMILTEVGNYVTEPTENIFTPAIKKMKKYKDMSETEKKKVIHELRLGKNPWRENQKMNWQLNKIADDLNSFERVRSYVSAYSSDGTIQGALDGILEAKKKVAYEKKMIAFAKRKYQPILKIYEEMKSIERKSYLYEYQNITEYRSEFERYRELTRRLKNNYNKEIFEVAGFMEECEERTLYANAQLNELSCQYRELKKYGRERGLLANEDENFMSVIGYHGAKDKNSIIEMDSFYVSSVNSGVVIRVMKNLGQNQKGNTYQTFNIEVLDASGNIIDEINNFEGNQGFYDSLKHLQDKYNLTTCKRFDTYHWAKEYSNRPPLPGKDVSLSFPQAINHVYEDRPMCVITDAAAPSYIALSSIQDDQLKVEVINKYGQHQEEIFIPLVKEKNSSGYSDIVELQKKYGFSDRVCEFNDITLAKKYISDVQRANTNSQRKGL